MVQSSRELLLFFALVLAFHVLHSQTALKWASFLSGDEDIYPAESHLDESQDKLYIVGSIGKGTQVSNSLGLSYGGGLADVGVMCLSPDGTTVHWVAYFGGRDREYGYAISTNSSGDVFVAGLTYSDDFPTNGTVAAFDEVLNGTASSFVARISSDGTTLQYSSYVGYCRASSYAFSKSLIAVGDVVYYGYQLNTGQSFPVSSGAYQPTNAGNREGVLFSIDTSVGGSSGLQWATYFGDDSNQDIQDMALDPNGDIWIAGNTDISGDGSEDFPITSDAFQSPSSLSYLADDSYGVEFLAKFSPSGDLLYSTLLLPLELDGFATYVDIEIDSEGNVYTLGFFDYLGTHRFSSTPYPNTAPTQHYEVISGASNEQVHLLAKLPASLGDTLEYLAVLDGCVDYGPPKLAIDGQGRAHVAIQVDQVSDYVVTAGSLPSVDPGYTYGYGIVNPTGTALEYLTDMEYGESSEWVNGLEIASDGTAYLIHERWGGTSYVNDIPSTPTYYDFDAGTQKSVFRPVPEGDTWGNIFVFHQPVANANTITDFPGGSNTFCVGGLIYQDPNEGPIPGSSVGYESGDGSSSTHNLPDLYFPFSHTLPHPSPLDPTLQWQKSYDASSWSNIPNENLEVLKPESESSAGTVYYRRLAITSGGDTSFSNTADATISGNFSLTINAPDEVVYYCPGTTKDLGISISGATGNISWQWYNGFAPLGGTEITPASGSGVAQGSFSADVATAFTEEGSYRLVVTDAGGCKKEATVTIGKLSADAGEAASTALCPGPTAEVTLGPEAINSDFDYSWTGPSSFTSSDANPTVSLTGTYTLEVKATADVSYCSAGATTVEVTANTAHDAALTTIPNSEFCQTDNPATIGLSGSVPEGYSFQWAPGINLDNTIAFNPTFDPGGLPFDRTPVDSVTYTFTALRASDGCVYETTTTVYDTAYATANAGSNMVACDSASIGSASTTGLYYQWEALSTTYASGFATLTSDPEFTIDGSNSTTGSNKFATVTAPITSGDDCYSVTYVLRTSYVPFPSACYSTDTMEVTFCCGGGGSFTCEEITASQQGINGACSGETTLLTATTYNDFSVEWTTYSVDGVVQPAGTAPQGLFEYDNGSAGAALGNIGPHPDSVIVNIDDVSWGWSSANFVVYEASISGEINSEEISCSTQITVFSGQNGSPVVDVKDLNLCSFPSPGIELGSSGLDLPYTLSGSDYNSAPNTGLNWSWTELEGGTTSISADANTAYPTLNPTTSQEYEAIAADPLTGCEDRDTVEVEVYSILTDAGSDISSVCEGSLVQLGSSGQPGLSYSWSPTSGLNFPIGTPNSTTAEPYLTVPNAPSGTSYTLTVTESTTGCQATDDMVVTSDANPPTSISNRSGSVCPGSWKYINMTTALEGHTYAWSIVSGGGDLSWFRDAFAPLTYINPPIGTSAGAYVFRLTITKGNCGSTTADYTLTVNSSPTPNLGAEFAASCSTPFSSMSTASGALSYSWYPTTGLYTDNTGTTPYDGNANSAYHTLYVEAVDEDQTYIITERSSNNCYGYDTIVVQASGSIEVDAGLDQIYCSGGDDLTLGVSNAGTTHTWTATGYNSDPEGTPATPSGGESTTMLGYLSSTSANVVTFSQSTATPGVYVYQLTSADGGGCSFSDEVTVTVPELGSNLAGTNKQVCYGNEVVLGVESPPNYYSYNWSSFNPNTENATINDNTLANPTVRPTVETAYRLLATDLRNGCVVTEYVSVSVSDLPNISDVSMSTVCGPMTPVDLTAQIPSYGTYSSQAWYINSYPGTVESTPTSVAPTETTDYYLYLTNDQACPDTITVTVNVETPVEPVVPEFVSTACVSNTVDLADYQGSPSAPTFTLEWHTDSSTNVATLVSNTEVGPGTYYLFETTPNSCESAGGRIDVYQGSCISFNSAPVALLQFSGMAKDKGNQLRWVTTEEVNNYGFQVQRKVEDSEWEEIAFLPGVGNKNPKGTHAYSYLDRSPAQNALYRLAQLDYNGDTQLSTVIEIRRPYYGKLTLFPNPFGNQLTLSGPPTLIKVYNVQGDLIHQINKPVGSMEVDTSEWLRGFYLFVWEDQNGATQTEKMRK